MPLTLYRKKYCLWRIFVMSRFASHLTAMSTTISLGFDTTSESSNIEDDSDVDAFDSHIFSSQSAYTHTFTSPAPEQCKNQPKKLPAAADETDITRTKTPSLPIE